MELDELIYQLEHLKNRIPFSVYEEGEKAKYLQALTESIALLRHLQRCIDLYEDDIKQPIDFNFYEKPQYDKMQICNPPEQNVIATVDAEWKDKILKNFMGRVE